jgi:4-hydroxy-tetrahydrodipicolinate synthase
MTGFPQVMAPVLTPFKDDLSCDGQSFVKFCRWLAGRGMGLAIFGTNSEANSLTVEERLELLARVSEAGIPSLQLVPGTGACAIGDSVRLGKAAVSAKCAGVLMLPPFYYKQVSDEGLYAAFAEVIERVGDSRLKILLYHIPQVSGVALSHDLIERLVKNYPNTIAGMKDSSGDLGFTRATIERFPGFQVYAGSDALLSATLQAGGAGCISATANVNPAAIVRLRKDWQGADAEALQTRLVQLRKTFEAFPMIAALKAAVAHFGDAPRFAKVRPPLTTLPERNVQMLITALADLNFTMDDLKETLSAE